MGRLAPVPDLCTIGPSRSPSTTAYNLIDPSPKLPFKRRYLRPTTTPRPCSSGAFNVNRFFPLRILARPDEPATTLGTVTVHKHESVLFVASDTVTLTSYDFPHVRTVPAFGFCDQVIPPQSSLDHGRCRPTLGSFGCSPINLMSPGHETTGGSLSMQGAAAATTNNNGRR